jgi:hypothetical protein
MKKLTLSFLSLALLASVAGPNLASAKHAQIDGVPYIEHQYGVCYEIKSNLGFGMRDKMTNGSVINLQAFLAGKGYLQVEPTGYYGALTLKAVRAFQKASGIAQTGFAGPLTRAQIKSIRTKTCSEVNVPKEVVISVATDKKVYKVGEEVEIEITATNPTNKEVTLNFNTGCQTSYMIDEYNSIAAMMCTQALTSKTIAANSSFTWEMTHQGMDYELKKGTHTVVGHVIDNGSATTTITVK